MSFNLSNIKWGWVILGVLIAFVISYGASICAVTAYASYLGFQARGAPDQAMITAFAEANAAGVGSIFVFLGTFLGGLLAGRKAKEDAVHNGLMVGILTALLDLALSLLGSFSPWAVVGLALAVVGGWLGGKLAGRRTGDSRNTRGA